MLLFVFLCGCLPLGVGGTYYVYKNREALFSYIPSVPSANPTDSPYDELMKEILTPHPADTPVPGKEPGPTQGPPTPTLQPVDLIRTLHPKGVEMQEWIRRGNVINGKNVMTLASGDPLYGYAEYREAVTAPVKFPISFLLGTSQLTITDETFRVTEAVSIDEAIYLPAILSQAQVIPNLTAPEERVVINPGTPQEEVVYMRPGVVLLPYVYTCYTGFGIKPWEQRLEIASESKYEKLTDAVVWELVALRGADQDVLTWALPRVRFTSVIAAYNAIIPIENGQRSFRILEEIHVESKALLTKSSGLENVPSTYDFLLAYFNSHAQQYDISRITEIQFGVVSRGNVICGSDAKLWDSTIEQTLSGRVPASFLLNPADLRPAITP